MGCFVFCFFYLQGQEQSFFVLSSEELAHSDAKKVKRVEKLLDKGRHYMEKAKAAQDKLEDYRKSGRDNAMRQIALKERVNRLYVRAYTYVGDAHKIQFKILKNLLIGDGLSDSSVMEEQLTKQFGQAAVLKRKANMMVGKTNPESLLAEATQKEVDVLERMEALVKEGNFVESPNLCRDRDVTNASGKERQIQLAVVEQDSILDVPASKFEDSVDSSTMVMGGSKEKLFPMKPERNIPVEPTDKRETAEKSAELFFSIQFLALRNAATEKEIRNVYGGALPVIKNKSDGWHRYSAGKFDTVEEALKVMGQENIHGFVVAFRNEERISISQARKMLERR